MASETTITVTALSMVVISATAVFSVNPRGQSGNGWLSYRARRMARPASKAVATAHQIASGAHAITCFFRLMVSNFMVVSWLLSPSSYVTGA
jgi:hypothetical protein